MKQMNSTYLEHFEQSLKIFKMGRLSKLMNAPGMYLRSTAMEWMAILFKRGIKAKAKLISGDEIAVMLPDLVSSALLRYGFFEEGLTRMFLTYLQPDMTFIDVGANLGYYTLLGAGIVGLGGQVHAFEPTPTTFELLRANTKGRSNVRLNRMAVYSKSGAVTLNDYGPRFAGCNSLYGTRLNHRAISHLRPINYEVETISLDEYIFANGISPNLIKIDAESAEYEILLGLKKTLNEIKPAISIEVGDMGVEGIPTSRDLILYLRDTGYQAYEFDGERISRHRMRDHYGHENLLFLPAR